MSLNRQYSSYITPAIRRQLDAADALQRKKAKIWARALRHHFRSGSISIPTLAKEWGVSELQLRIAFREGAVTKKLYSQIVYQFPAMKRSSTPFFIIMGKTFGRAVPGFFPPVSATEQAYRDRFAESILAFRQRAGLSQYQIADLAQISQTQVSKIEQGKLPRHGSTAQAILKRWPELQQDVPEPATETAPKPLPEPDPHVADLHEPAGPNSEPSCPPMTNLQLKIKLLEQQLELQKLARSLRHLSTGVQKLADRNEYVERQNISEITIRISDQINVHLTALS